MDSTTEKTGFFIAHQGQCLLSHPRFRSAAGTIPDVGEGQLECLQRLKLAGNSITGKSHRARVMSSVMPSLFFAFFFCTRNETPSGICLFYAQP